MADRSAVPVAVRRHLVVVRDPRHVRGATERAAAVNLATLIIAAPVIGIADGDVTQSTVHAVTLDGLPIKTWPNGTATSACGVPNVRVLVDQERVALWPPAVKNLPEGTTRCRACQQATGNKRPRRHL